MDQSDKLLSFLRVGDLGERMCCYVPICLGAEEVIAQAVALLGMLKKCGPGLSSESSRYSLSLNSLSNVSIKSVLTVLRKKP